MEAVGLAYSDVMKLSEMGLIFNDGLISLDLELTRESSVLSINRDLVMTISSRSEEGESASIPLYPFTQSGIELAPLVEDMASDEDFLLFGKELAKETNYNVGLHKIVEWENSEPIYESNNLLN